MVCVGVYCQGIIMLLKLDLGAFFFKHLTVEERKSIFYWKKIRLLYNKDLFLKNLEILIDSRNIVMPF